jgi:Zn-dependent protease
MSAELSFANYTANAQTSLVQATREAELRHHAQVLPEHILLALLTPEAGTAWSVLAGTIRNPLLLQEGLHLALTDAALAGSAPPLYGFRGKRVLSEAEDEARRAGQIQIDTSHLLLGLLDEGGPAGQLLRRNGVDVARLRHWLRQPPTAAVPEAGISPASRPGPVRVAAPVPVRLPAVSNERALQLERLPLKQALPRLISWPALLVMLGLLIGGGALCASSDANVAQAGLVILVIDGWIVSLCAHEFSHAFTADLGGDHSVRDNGYLSFNPLKYTHPLLSIIMPVIFMLIGGIGLPGGAVYIQTARLRGPKWESAVSFAGPAASALMALLFGLPFLIGLFNWERYLTNPFLWQGFAVVALLNCAAVVLNLVPVPPLDGFGIIAPLLSPSLRAFIYTFSLFGFFIVFFLLISNPSIQEAFNAIIDNMLQVLKISPELASWGLYNFAFWRS